MRPVEDIERELALVKAERDALARHVECLRAPVTTDEARASAGRLNSVTMRLMLDEFIRNRQLRAQHAALS